MSQSDTSRNYTTQQQVLSSAKCRADNSISDLIHSRRDRWGFLYVRSNLPCMPLAQVTDTPGLLNRPDSERNAMERLTLAALEHLPTAVLFVMDLTGECGTSPASQWRIRCVSSEY